VTLRRTFALLVGCLALALVAAGCGGSSKKSSGGKSNPAPSSSSSSSSSSGSGEVTVGMKNIQFTPKDVTVKVGQTIKWVNDEDIPHNVKAQSGATFSSDTFGKGGSFTFTPKKAGKISYVCTIHAPNMAGTITVQ
jgi:plastocyanin